MKDDPEEMIQVQVSTTWEAIDTVEVTRAQYEEMQANPGQLLDSWCDQVDAAGASLTDWNIGREIK